MEELASQGKGIYEYKEKLVIIDKMKLKGVRERSSNPRIHCLLERSKCQV